MNLIRSDQKLHWSLQPFPDSNIKLWFYDAPNFLHRWMQRLVFGFRWERHE